MKRLYWFNLKRVVRSREEMFWALVFPLLMATLFYASFGSGINPEAKREIPAAVVSEAAEPSGFASFLAALDGDLLKLEEMTEEEALQALSEGKINGIFYADGTPHLTVAASQMNESILGELLDGYLQGEVMMQEIGTRNILKLPLALSVFSENRELVQNGPGSNAESDNLVYFFALIGMTCLFGSFSGMSASMNLRADQSALAARRSIIPVGRAPMVVSELLACFTAQFFNVCVLLLYLHFGLGISFGEKWALLLPVCVLGSIAGVAYGIFVGSLHLIEGAKTGLLVASSLAMSFLAGLMLGNMKDIIEHHAPIINRINPAALIADAFYSISIYENPARYRMNLLLLALITAGLVILSFVRLGRERYDSL